MVSRVLFQGWLLRDVRQTSALFVLTALVVGFLVYFIDWRAARHDNIMNPRLTSADKDDKGQRYTGSIIIPTASGLCLEVTLDNRTGEMRDKGYHNCNEIVSRLTKQNQLGGVETMRLRAVGDAFRHDSK